MDKKQAEKIKLSSRISGFLIIAGLLIFLLALAFGGNKLHEINKELDQKKETLEITNSKLNELTSRLSSTRENLDLAELKTDSLELYFDNMLLKVDSLKNDERTLTQFLINLIKTSQENVQADADNIDWEILEENLNNMPSGKRKSAIFISLLMTWKEVPFDLGKKNPSVGFDSPRFLAYVLNQVGIKVQRKPNEPLSVTLMNKFDKVDTPKIGDLIFYKGQIGNFGLIYLGPNKDDSSQGIGIGTLQSISPLSIYDTKNLNIEFYPLRGFYRVNYEDFD
ncbi:NlpC/P60 family protein [Flagellimonas sp.]|uniref:NlpC/P60 family protein n=1 Tax=Flagellimonas sp. TaxID=2058762 RepID=UPI003B509993